MRPWPYPPYRQFYRDVTAAAARWFAGQGLPVHPQRPDVLANRDEWDSNLILPEVRAFKSRRAGKADQPGRRFFPALARLQRPE